MSHTDLPTGSPSVQPRISEAEAQAERRAALAGSIRVGFTLENVPVTVVRGEDTVHAFFGAPAAPTRPVLAMDEATAMNLIDALQDAFMEGALHRPTTGAAS